MSAWFTAITAAATMAGVREVIYGEGGGGGGELGDIGSVVRAS